jgi:DNA-binding NarL/FixJ family response regulator
VIEKLDVFGEDLIVLSWSTEPAPTPDGLSAAESEILARIVRGESNATIARARRTSVRTVANQVASLLRKTGAASRYELIRRFASGDRDAR